MRAKRNFEASVGPVLVPVANVNEGMLKRGHDKTAAWHWYPADEYEKQLQIIDWDDPDYPKGELISCGNLIRLHFRAPNPSEDRRHPRRQRDTTLTLSHEVAKRSFIAFDPNQANDRLYLLIPSDATSRIATRFWDENPAPAKPLKEWAFLAGGRHARGDYPNVVAKPVGVMTAVVYWTDKKDDGPSYYIHNMGEIDCIMPILACDEKGRLWMCGGAYRCPEPGVTG